MDKKCSAKDLDRRALIHVVKNAPLVSIDLIIKNDNNEILLGKRKNSPAKDWWFVPGGRIYKCENLNNAFIRITKDELGKTFTENDARFLGVYTHKYNDNFAQEEDFGTHYVVLAYVLELNLSLNLLNLPRKQHDEYRWFKEDVIQQDSKVHQHVKDYCPIPPLSNDLGLYSSLMAQYCHYDRQMWSRTQILLAIQGAAFIGGYKLSPCWLSYTIMVATAILILLIWGLIKRDQQNRDGNLKVMDSLVGEILQRPRYPRLISLLS